MGKHCKHCKWWEPEINKFGLCRLRPPEAKGTSGKTTDGWPTTDENDWCGSFTAYEPQAEIADSRPGAAVVEVTENGIVRVTHTNGDQFQLSAFDPLTQADAKVLERMAWPMT